MSNEAINPVAKLGENLRIARKRRGLRIVDLAKAVGCSHDTLRRLERGDQSVSLGVLARVMQEFGAAEALGAVLDAAQDTRGLAADVRRLPLRVRRPVLPVERISGEQFRAEKRVRQENSYARIASGEVPKDAFFAFSEQMLKGATFKWPAGGFSAPEEDDDLDQHSAPALGR